MCLRISSRLHWTTDETRIIGFRHHYRYADIRTLKATVVECDSRVTRPDEKRILAALPQKSKFFPCKMCLFCHRQCQFSQQNSSLPARVTRVVHDNDRDKQSSPVTERNGRFKTYLSPVTRKTARRSRFPVVFLDSDRVQIVNHAQKVIISSDRYEHYETKE